ncbi:26S proteasome regulatory subunit rpn10 [Tritrichomonas foetus]|uniref:26S proteasome regulatory subunit rpn10 n=1 Tax=Tritrichomonas foetus TaxID=1144522 RepID=A0A1J4KP56_9EUKA|nr:26S proteasome regulatory subunit rpn10 [Tritrichomonas foetus]|eukprot:OHT11580.1 26S proteasome regulatory subunit rpn10 [Tritrichomonas foetus]
MSEEAQAIVILLDNSDRSIDGDFHPNRLDAQKIASERLIQFFVRQNKNSVFSIGTLARNKIGIIASLTTDQRKITNAMAKIETGGSVQLFQGIRCAFLALHHRDEKIIHQRVIVFVGSAHDLNFESAYNLIQLAHKEKVSIDIIAFGEDVQNIEVLESITTEIGSHFVRAQVDPHLILSDIVLSSPIGPGKDTKAFNNSQFEDDPDLYLTLQLSKEDSYKGAEDEYNRAIAESLREFGGAPPIDEDAELQRAIQESLMSQNTNQNMKEQQNEENDDDDDDDKNDPDLLEAILLSKQNPHKQPKEEEDGENDQ